MTYQAVLFDLDGTLLDTLEDLAGSVNSVLSEQGFPPHPVPAYKHLLGDGVEYLISQSLPEKHRDDAMIARCIEAMLRVYADRWAVKTRPYDGVPEMLTALTKRGVKMAVLSNKLDEFTKKCVTKLLPDWPFEQVMGIELNGLKKPDPAGALRIAEKMKIPPERFCYLGDTNTDMQTANAARMFPIGALWGFRSAEELTSHGAKVLIKKPTDLLKHL